MQRLSFAVALQLRKGWRYLRFGTLRALLCSLPSAVSRAVKVCGCLKHLSSGDQCGFPHSLFPVLPLSRDVLFVLLYFSGRFLARKCFRAWQLPDNERRVKIHFPPPYCWSLAVDDTDGVCCCVDPYFHSNANPCVVRRARGEFPSALGGQRGFTLKARWEDKTYFTANVSFPPFSKLSI